MSDSLEQFQTILQQLEERTTRLLNPDPNFPFGTSGNDWIEPSQFGVIENIFGNSGDDIIYGLGNKDINVSSTVSRWLQVEPVGQN